MTEPQAIKLGEPGKRIGDYVQEREKARREKSKGGSGGSSPAPTTPQEAFQQKLREENIINSQGQIRPDKIQRYNELYAQMIKKPGDFETYQREGFVPAKTQEDAKKILAETERAFVDREQEILRNKKVVVVNSPDLGEQEKRELAVYTRLYGRPTLTQTEQGTRADFYAVREKEVKRVEGVETPFQFEAPRPGAVPFLPLGEAGRQTRTDLKPGWFETFPNADYSSLYFGEVQPAPTKKFNILGETQQASIDFKESVNRLQRGDTSPYETLKLTGEGVRSAGVYVQTSAGLGVFRFGENIYTLVTRPVESGTQIIETGAQFVADPKTRTAIISSSAQKFIENPIAYTTEAGLNIFSPGKIYQGGKAGVQGVRSARFNRAINSADDIITDPRRLDYLDPQKDIVTFQPGLAEGVPGRGYVQYKPGVQLTLYGKAVPDELITAKVPDYTPQSPFGLPDSYYQGLRASRVVDEGVFFKDVQKPLNQPTFTIYDRKTGTFYKNVPGDSQIIQNYFKEGSPRFFDDPTGSAKVEGVSRAGLPRYDIFSESPLVSRAKPQAEAVATPRQVSLKEFDLVPESPGRPVKPVTDNLVFSTLPGAEAVAKTLQRGVDYVADLKTRGVFKKSSDFEAGSSGSVSYTSLTYAPVSSLAPERDTSLTTERPLLFVPRSDLQAEPVSKLKEEVLIKSVLLEKQAQKEDRDLIIIPVTRSGSITRQITGLEPITETAQVIAPPVVVPPRPLGFPGRPVPEVPARPPGFPVPSLPKGETERVFARPKGFIAVDIKGRPISPVLSREGALSYGARVVDRTALRSFRLKESGQIPLNLNIPSSPGTLQKFYRSRKGFFVEKQRYAIDTPGEYGEISFKGLLTLGNKRARSVFNQKQNKGGKRGIF